MFHSRDFIQNTRAKDVQSVKSFSQEFNQIHFAKIFLWYFF